jgi:hypothetical protein
MTYIIIKKLIESGDLKSLEKAGIISLNVRMKFEMYEMYVSKKEKTTSVKYDWEAIETVAIHFKCDSRSVYRAIKVLE